MNYTANQKDAIATTDRNLQIIACAGSGKTQVIAARIVEILADKKLGVRPANIVAFTYMDKAAGELKDRIYRLCKERLGSDLGLAEMFVGTIHSFCLRMLQSPPLYKFLKFSVLSDVQQRLLIDRYYQKSGLTQVPLLKGGTLQRWQDSRLYQQLLSVLGEGQVDYEKISADVKNAVAQYHGLLNDKRYLDYTTIMTEALNEIRSNKALRVALSSQLKFLVVDEYQDVNSLQEALIRELHMLGANICVVGDDDQTIYQWRGSDVTNIIDFKKRYANVKQVPLNENFRSSKGVVLSARKVIENNPDRLPKKMESVGTQIYANDDVLALKFEDVEEEALWLAEKIVLLHKTAYKDRPDSEPRGLSYADMAVLLRSVKHDAQPIIEALKAARIPYIVGGMNGLFDTHEIQTVREVFYFLADFTPQGDIPVTIKRLQQLFAGEGWGLPSDLVSAVAEYIRKTKSKIGDVMDASLYLQRVYLDLLETMQIREEEIDKSRATAHSGEVVYYNLGKFSQVISDFEQINFNTRPKDLYPYFAQFLFHQAPNYYPEGWENAGNARPDAVEIMTVHQAKGMQWPVVFIPCLRNNRFPSRRQGGRSVWHIIPDSSVTNVERYKGTQEDERRLFYVALTRAEKFLFCTWAPIPDNQQQRNVSPFLAEFTASELVLTKEPKVKPSPRLAPRLRDAAMNLALTFSGLKYYFECPYLFKLRFLYGFDAPVDRAIGFGKSLHDALAELHSESLKGNIPSETDIPRLVDDHLHLPFANEQVAEYLREAAKKALVRYLRDHKAHLDKLEHVEKIVELKLEEGIVVNGRIDLIRRTDSNETVIVDFKSDERAQAEEVTQKQLHVYALGYEQLTGKSADLIEVHNLDKGGARREMIDRDLLMSTTAVITQAGKKLRENQLPRLANWCKKCEGCDLVGICRSKS